MMIMLMTLMVFHFLVMMGMRHEIVRQQGAAGQTNERDGKILFQLNKHTWLELQMQSVLILGE